MYSPDNMLPSQIINSLIAAILYMLTYLSLLNFLKYPRNWIFPKTSATLMTIILTTITVLFASLSLIDQNISLDYNLMLFLSGFFFILFGIISSPAIDFNPGSRRVIEFLANHGDTAGVWMIIPAIVGAYVFQKPSLYGVLVISVFFPFT